MSGTDPDYTRTLDIAVASIARVEEQERPAEATHREVESVTTHREVESTTRVAGEAYRAQLVEERVRAWANARARTHPNLPGSLNREGLTMAEVHAIEMMIGFYRERPQRPLSRESTPSPPPTGFPSLRMISVGPSSSEEPQAAFEVLGPARLSALGLRSYTTSQK